MGLDLVEFAMEVEETFGIEIDDRDGERLETIGDVRRYVLAKLLEGRTATACPSASGFYLARRALMDRWEVARLAVRPGTRIDDLMPATSRAEAWRGFGEAAGLALPRLVLPRWCWYSAFALAMAPAVALFAEWLRLAGFDFGAIFGIGVTTIVLLIGVPILMNTLERAFGRNIPAGFETVGDVSRRLGRKAFRDIDPDRRGPDVRETLLDLVAIQFGVRKDQLKDETSFVHDLGAD